MSLEASSEELRLNVSRSRREIVLDALQTLEFRKVFLILNYIGSCNLEDVVSADKIMNYQTLSMKEFEVEIWNYFGRIILHEDDRLNMVNWESRERYYYYWLADLRWSKG